MPRASPRPFARASRSAGRCRRCCPEFWITLAQLHRHVSLVALGLVLLTGVGGMTSFGQAAFVGFGAYTTRVLTTR